MEKFALITELGTCMTPLQAEHLFWFRDEFPASEFQDHIHEKWGETGRDGWHTISCRNLRFTCHDLIPDVLCEVSHDGEVKDVHFATMSGFLYPACHQSLRRGGIPLHAALMERDGKGYLLTGSGQTGKSTSCRRIPAPWNPVCDDGVWVLIDQAGKYQVHPMPTWSEYTMRRSEKTWDIQHAVPLAGIFILEKSDTDEVIPVGSGRAAIVINQSANQSWGGFWKEMADGPQKTTIRKQAFENACRLADAVPTFRLRATLHGSFWKEMESVTM